MFDPKLKEALGRVQKPGRYTGGEPGSVYKDKEKMDVRFAFCFPDTYEVGMSFLGEKILYELLNSHENWWCERAFMPWLDMNFYIDRVKMEIYTNPACGVGVNIQLVLRDFYLDIQKTAEQRMQEITLKDVLEQYHMKLEGMPLQRL